MDLWMQFLHESVSLLFSDHWKIFFSAKITILNRIPQMPIYQIAIPLLFLVLNLNTENQVRDWL